MVDPTQMSQEVSEVSERVAEELAVMQLDLREANVNQPTYEGMARMLYAMGWRKVGPGEVVVPVEPTHRMERAYFSAPIPAFKLKISGAARRIKNHEKMLSRWRALLAAAAQPEEPKP